MADSRSPMNEDITIVLWNCCPKSRSLSSLWCSSCLPKGSLEIYHSPSQHLDKTSAMCASWEGCQSYKPIHHPRLRRTSEVAHLTLEFSIVESLEYKVLRHVYSVLALCACNWLWNTPFTTDALWFPLLLKASLPGLFTPILLYMGIKPPPKDTMTPRERERARS